MGSGTTAFVMLTSILVLITIFQATLCSLKWEELVGPESGLPGNAAVIHPNSKLDFYMCRVPKQDGGFLIGHLVEGREDCIYTDGQTAGSADKGFQVLTIANTETLSSESLGWKFLPRDDSPPENGVPCDLEGEGDQACYLGMAVYSDGICVEALGFIDLEEKKVFMAQWDSSMSGVVLKTCPFYIYLVIEDNMIVT